MQRKLQLDEDIRRRALPGQIVAQIAAIGPIEIHIRYCHAAAAMVGARVKKGHAIKAQIARIEDPARRPLPVLLASRSEEHTSELQSLMRISYAVFCLNTKKQ